MAVEESKTPIAPSDNPESPLDIPEGEKPDLFEYLAGLPDVEEGDIDEIDNSSPEEASETQVEIEPENKVEILASLIRSRSKAALITPLAALQREDDETLELLETLFSDEAYKDIVCLKGDKDSYYYSNKIMTNSFANIAVLVEEKNDTRTLAHCVRERSSYPALTYAHFFAGYPFYFSAPQLEQIKANVKAEPNYEDIQVISSQGVEFFYSTQHLKPEIASYLAEELLNERP